MIPTKVVFVGNSNSGKTTVARQLNNQPNPGHHTLGVEVIQYTSPNGSVYHIWDTAGKECYRGLADAYCMCADIVIIFHGGETYKTVAQWEQESLRSAPNATIFHVDGNISHKYALVHSILA